MLVHRVKPHAALSRRYESDGILAVSMPGACPFAMMFLTHQAIRKGIDTAVEAIERKSLVAKWTWKGLNDAILLHSKQEDDILFPLITEIPVDFEDGHRAEEKLRERITKDLSNGKIGDGVSGRVREWRDMHLAHLKYEEEHFVPLLEEKTTTAEERGALVKQIIQHDRASFMCKEVPFVLKQLLKFDEPNNMKMVAMYTEAVQYSTSPDEYLLFLSVLKDTVGEKVFQNLMEADK